MPPKTTFELDAGAERSIGVALFNRVWDLLETDDRSEDQQLEMIHAAHASAYHWSRVGEPVNFVRSEWQCSRVYAIVAMPESALFHARRALQICEAAGIDDFDLAFVHEAMARAYAVLGDGDEARRWLETARASCANITEDDERELVLSDLGSVPIS